MKLGGVRGYTGLVPWLAACWQEARYNSRDLPTLLSPAQERALWHRIIQQHHPRLFDIAATVRLAGRASNLIAEWHIPTDGEDWNEHPDARQFQLWLRLFRRQCRENGWITRADLWRLVPEWLKNGSIQPSLTVFLGFQEFSWALQNLQRTLGHLAVQQPFDSRLRINLAPLKQCTELSEELDFAARRARFVFEKEKSRSIGMFVPELGEKSAQVERALTSVFLPAPAFHINAGKPLFNHPLIAAALLLLQLAKPRIDHADAGAILRSPFIKGALAERNARAFADLDLRRRRELDVRLEDIRYASRYCALLSRMFRNVKQR